MGANGVFSATLLGSDRKLYFDPAGVSPRWESAYGHAQVLTTKIAQTAQAPGSHAKHADTPALGKNEMGARPLAMGLCDPSLGMGLRALEQIEREAFNSHHRVGR